MTPERQPSAPAVAATPHLYCLDHLRIEKPDLGFLEKLPALTTLALHGKWLPRAGFESIGRLGHLKVFSLVGTGLTDADLQQLRGLSSLEELYPGFFIAESIHNSQEEKQRITPYERLLNAETKLQSLLSKANKDYRQAQQDRQKRQVNEPDNAPEPFCLFAIKPNQEETQFEPADEESKVPSATPDHTAQQSATPPTKKTKIKPTCQNDTLSPLARAAASAARQLIDQEGKGAYDTP